MHDSSKSLKISYKSRLNFESLIKTKLLKQIKMVEATRTNQRNESTTAQKSSSSVHGEQPKSLNVHWMKYDVTKENIETSVSSMPS